MLVERALLFLASVCIAWRDERFVLIRLMVSSVIRLAGGYPFPPEQV
jgi:hypothetical protein